MRMFCVSICVILDIYSLSYAGTQKKKRLRYRRFGFCLGLYKSFLRGAGGEAADSRALSVSLTLDISPARGGDKIGFVFRG